jgi:acyl-CoA thioesterase-2
MNQLLDDLIKVMTLERLEMNLFRAGRGVAARKCSATGCSAGPCGGDSSGGPRHRRCAYFLRRSGFNAPIVYEVDRAMDGKHFSSRRVVAIQPGRPIFNMSASFQSAETGLEHQISIPEVPPPESLPDVESHYRAMADKLPPAAPRVLEQKRPFEFRPVQPPDPMRRDKSAPLKHVVPRRGQAARRRRPASRPARLRV